MEVQHLHNTKLYNLPAMTPQVSHTATERMQEPPALSFEEIVKQYQDMLLNVILSMLQNKEEAEEILQDVFIKLFEYGKYNGWPVYLSTWLYRVAVNTSMDVLRKRKQVKRGGWLQRIFNPSQEELPVNFEHPGIVLQKKENASLLFKALQQLPEKQMAAFLLQQLEDKTVKEVGDILNTSTTAAESLLKRAKENLRKLLTKEIIQL